MKLQTNISDFNYTGWEMSQWLLGWETTFWMLSNCNQLTNFDQLTKISWQQRTVNTGTALQKSLGCIQISIIYWQEPITTKLPVDIANICGVITRETIHLTPTLPSPTSTQNLNLNTTHFDTSSRPHHSANARNNWTSPPAWNTLDNSSHESTTLRRLGKCNYMWQMDVRLCTWLSSNQTCCFSILQSGWL